jgi:hypothetical protein
MGDLDEAIREHLELKRRRGADPAEVAREEHEALAPVTRGHAIVVPEDLDAAALREDRHPSNGGAEHDAGHEAQHDGPPQEAHAAGSHEDLGDATQEFRVVHDDPDDWLGEHDEV